MRKKRATLGPCLVDARRRFALVVPAALTIALTITSVRARETEASDRMDAPALVRHVREGEQWIDGAESLRISGKGTWRRPAAVVAALVEARKKQLPNERVDAERFPELKGEGSFTLELGFDRTRTYARREEPEGVVKLDLRVWDGKRGWVHEVYPAQEHVAIVNEPYKLIGQSFLTQLSWPRAGDHAYWWVPEDRRLGESFYGRPEDFRLTGRQHFRGVECDVLETDFFYRTLYVGVADRRLYGIGNRVLPNEGIRDEADPILIGLAAEFGKSIRNTLEYYAWERTLAEADRAKVQREYFKRLRPLSVPQTEQWCAGYREVAPGRWIPMRQGVDTFEARAAAGADAPVVGMSLEITLSSVVVGRPLPVAWFRFDPPEGVQVTDWSHTPPLSYKYKKHFGADEWQAILDDARGRQVAEKQRTAPMDALIGKPAPAFPPGATWLNAKPLTWAELRGKPVVISLWATWCAPCKNDLPKLVALHEARDREGVTVIGIHAAGTPAGELGKMMKEFGINYPVVIDATSPGGTAGVLFKGLGASTLPHSFVVDTEGRIAGHGSLAEAMKLAEKLAGATSSTAPARDRLRTAQVRQVRVQSVPRELPLNITARRGASTPTGATNIPTVTAAFARDLGRRPRAGREPLRQDAISNERLIRSSN